MTSDACFFKSRLEIQKVVELKRKVCWKKKPNTFQVNSSSQLLILSDIIEKVVNYHVLHLKDLF